MEQNQIYQLSVWDIIFPSNWWAYQPQTNVTAWKRGFCVLFWSVWGAFQYVTTLGVAYSWWRKTHPLKLEFKFFLFLGFCRNFLVNLPDFLKKILLEGHRTAPLCRVVAILPIFLLELTRYHLFTSPQVPCVLGSFGLGLNSKWEETDASLQELSSLATLGVELAELPEPYKVAAIQNRLIKLYSHINWSKIFTSDQEVLYFLIEKQAQCRSRQFYCTLKVT